MDFLRSCPTLTLGDDLGHEHKCFGADLFNGRPGFQNIQAFQEWAGKQQDIFMQKMEKKACPVQWLGLFVDQEGAMLIATRHSGANLNNMRVGLKTMLSALPDELQKAVATTLRPLDELDRVRIDGWQTVNDLRGEDSSDEDSPAQETTLALRQAGQVEMSIEGGALVAWAARARAYATICLASTGDVPALTYIRCSEKKQRRHLLLLNKVREEKAEILADVVRIAAALAKNGSLPAPGRQRTCEFMRRCVEALKVVNPKAETEVTNLPKEEQEVVRRALGDEVESYQGCLSEGCLDEEIVWETIDLGDDLKMSRCVHCRMPKAMGRTLTNPLDFVKERLKRERGMTFGRSEENMRNVRRRYVRSEDDLAS
jgi:hypothetical protein